MSAICKPCPPAQDCVFPSDLELYGLQGPQGPWSWIRSGMIWQSDRNSTDGGRWITNGGIPVPPNRRAPGTFPPTNVPVQNPYPAVFMVGNEKQSACFYCSAFSFYCFTCQPNQFRRQAIASQYGDILKVVNASALAYAKSKVSGYQGRCMRNESMEKYGYIGACLGSEAISESRDFVGVPNCTWSVQGALPPGIALYEDEEQSGTASLVGTFNTAGIFEFTVVATSEDRNSTLNLKTVVSVLGITNAAALPGGNLCRPYSTALNIQGGVPPYRVFVNENVPGRLPQGLIIVQNSRIAGTPTTVGTSNFTLSVVDSRDQGCNKRFSMTIDPPLVPVSIDAVSPLPNAHRGYSYFAYFGVHGDCSPYAGQIVGGSLPPGTQIGFALGNWAIYGTPTTPGTYSFDFKATDTNGGVAIKNFQVTVDTDELVTGTCANNPNIAATGSSPQLGGYSATINAELTKAAAIDDLISKLQALGCTCPPCRAVVNPGANDVIITNSSLTCSVPLFVDGTPPCWGSGALAPGESYNFRACCADSGINPAGKTVHFHIGGGVIFDFTF